MTRQLVYSYIAAALVIAACSAQPEFVPVTTTERIQVHNFSVMPPKGGQWYRPASRGGPLELGLKSDDPTHTFVLMAGYWGGVAPNDPGTPQALKDGVQKGLDQRNQGRWHTVNCTVSQPYRFKNTDCVSYDLVQEEHDNPNFSSGTILIMTDHGVYCRYPGSPETVQVFFSERYKQGDKPYNNPELTQDANAFIESVEFTSVQ